MTLIEAKKGYTYKIKSLNCIESNLKNRLYSLGIYEGVEITTGYTSLWQHTYTIYISGAHVALRRNEAELIEIEMSP